MTLISLIEREMPEDHLHIVVRGEAKISPSQIMAVCSGKSISASEFFKLYSEIKKRDLWEREALDSALFC